MAEAAVRSGRRDDLGLYLEHLHRRAEGRGAWSGDWHSDAKLHLHRLKVEMNGAGARLTAFDAFAGDLARGRESTESVLPNLCKILEVISPQVSWAELWAHLGDHLRCFREYAIGRDLEPNYVASDAEEQTLADILFRAIDTTASELTRMAIVASWELVHLPGGPAVVGGLVRRLWLRGGDHAHVGVRIAWDCRDATGLRSELVADLPKLTARDDLAVRQTAAALARSWGQQPIFPRTNLPVAYHVELPSNSQAERFELPLGLSSASPGLWTGTWLDWTWPLEGALKIAAKASGHDIARLRARAATLMGRAGGADAFGPQMVERQMARMSSLSLHATHRRLAVSAALTAMREVAGELAAAGVIDPRALPLVLREAGAFAPGIASLAPSPRPMGVSMVSITGLHGRGETEAWREAAEDDAMAPTVNGFVVLASTAVHERQHFQDRWMVEQYSGPDHGYNDRTLWSQLSRLPRVIMTAGVGPLYDGMAKGAVVHPDPDTASSVPPYAVMLCPRVAGALGWRLDMQDLFTYRDAAGNVVVQTLRWRDGGVRYQAAEDSSHGDGCLLLVRSDLVEMLSPYLLAKNIVRAWRATQTGDEARVVVTGSRTIQSPVL